MNLFELFKGNYDFNENFKDFVYCTATRTKLYNEDGRPNLENLNNFYKDQADVQAVLKECSENIEGERPKDVAANYLKCYLKKTPIYIVFWDLIYSNKCFI